MGDLETCRFEPGRFDLVYAIGVLAEHAPLTDALAQRVFGWLSPGGAFAFTAVHPDSFSIVGSWKRRLGRRAMAFAPGVVREWLRMRWLGGGLYADESAGDRRADARRVRRGIARSCWSACICIAWPWAESGPPNERRLRLDSERRVGRQRPADRV